MPMSRNKSLDWYVRFALGWTNPGIIFQTLSYAKHTESSLHSQGPFLHFVSRKGGYKPWRWALYSIFFLSVPPCQRFSRCFRMSGYLLLTVTLVLVFGRICFYFACAQRENHISSALYISKVILWEWCLIKKVARL